MSKKEQIIEMVKERQGYAKLKVSLQQVRKMDIFKEIEQPGVVYHMTDRKNLESILEDRKIRSFNDYLTFFFTNEEQAPLYIELSGALNGRHYYGTDGMLKTAPPLIVEDTVVLKLVPKKKEKLEWYREVIDGTKSGYETVMTPDIQPLWDEFNNCRVAHYGDFQFDMEKVEIIELSDVYKNLSDGMAKTIERVEELQKTFRRNRLTA